ncbi:unnamed protein product [Rhodiola kirilowii]
MNEFFGTWISSMLLLLLLISVEGDPGGGVNVVNPPPSPPPYPSAAPFKPSVVVVVCILTTIFSITFLLLLYAKHCKRATNGYGGSPGSNVRPSAMRKNSGVRRAVVESLPVFRFGSLSGPKDGLECAVCLSTFEPSEVLRLLPKCKHAFHVECVDTWLDAHSTCPLCRYRVDPEDILLVQELSNPLHEHQPLPAAPNENASVVNNTQRVSGRHSSAGERGSINNNNKLLQIILQSSSRRSLDSRTKPEKTPIQKRTETSTSSSHDAHPHRSSSSVGFFEKSRKDGLLLASDEQQGSFEKRFEHRIMISDHNNSNSNNERWSDLQPSDLIYLRSEMIINDSRRRYTSARGSPNRVAESEPEEAEKKSTVEMNGGRIVINPRSVSEIVGVSRRRDDCENRRQRRNQHVAGVLSRWLAWVSSHGQRPSIDHSLPLLSKGSHKKQLIKLDEMQKLGLGLSCWRAETVAFRLGGKEPLPEAKDDINSAHSLSVEVAYINQNFSQQVLLRDGNKDRRWKLDNDMYLVARCEVQSVMEVNNQKMNKYRSHPPKAKSSNPFNSPNSRSDKLLLLPALFLHSNFLLPTMGLLTIVRASKLDTSLPENIVWSFGEGRTEVRDWESDEKLLAPEDIKKYQIFDASSANSKVYELLTKDIELQKEQVEAVRKEAESQVMMKRLEERIRALEEKSIGNAAGEDP